MGLIGNMIDWAADKVQTVTGEKERRELVSKLKAVYRELRQQVEEKINEMNLLIEEFNFKIRHLNQLREGKVEANIYRLFGILSRFGEAKAIGEYVKEEEKLIVALPEQQFEKTEDYINEVDWSKDDVFLNTFFLSPIGMTAKTKKQNLSMRESIGELELEMERTLAELRSRRFWIEQEKQICDLYIECIEFISDYIRHTILPELEMVEAFFQAQKLKNQLLADQPLEGVVFRNNIQLLRETVYEKHYMFVKNTFMFYILSCKIYHTPVLTRLLNRQSSAEDLNLIKMQHGVLIQQARELGQHLVIER